MLVTLLVRGPQSQVITQQLHDERRVLVMGVRHSLPTTSLYQIVVVENEAIVVVANEAIVVVENEVSPKP